MKIYSREMLKVKPSREHIIDDIEDRDFGPFKVGCASIAITNILCFYGKEFERANCLLSMLTEAHLILEGAVNGGVKGENILNFLYNEGLDPKIINFPRELDLLEAVADPRRAALLIIHIGEDIHIQILQQSKTGQFSFGNLELNMDELINLVNERSPYTTEKGLIHYSPSVLIKLKRRVDSLMLNKE